MPNESKNRNLKKMNKWTVLFSIAAAFPAFGDFCIVKDGKPAAAIVWGEKPVKSAQMGAYELQHHVRMMTGAVLPIVKNRTGAGNLNIIQIGGENDDLKGESSRIRFSGRKLLLTGADKKDFGKVDYQNHRTFPGSEYHNRGSLYAVYDFLEEYCGFRFYFFEDSDTFFKPSKNLSVKEKNREFSPSFDAHRQIWISSREDFDRLFKYTPRQIELWRMRWRLSILFGFANHNQYSIWFRYWRKAKMANLAPEFIRHRPELFAQGYKGKSMGADPILSSNYPDDRDLPSQLCYSNPETIEYFAREAVTYLHGKNVRGGWMNMTGTISPDRTLLPRIPGAPYFYPLEGGDNPHYCKCAKCLALRESGKQSDSNMKFAFIAKVAKRAAELDPAAGIATLAYITNLAYPDKVKLPDNVAVGICLTNYTWYHPVVRSRQLAEYKKWVTNEKNRVLTLWTYIFSPWWDAQIHFGNYKPFPGLYPWKIGEQFKMFGQDGIRGWFTCIQLQYNHLEGYIAARLSYDKSLDPDKIIDEYFQNYYGKAGNAMKQFYKEVENIYWNPANYPKKWSESKSVVLGPNGPKHPFWCTGMHSPEINAAMWTQARYERLNGLIEQARKLVSSPNEKKHLDRVVKLIWEPAVQGRRYFLWLESMKKRGAKNLFCIAGPEYNGNHQAVDWNKLPSTGQWSDVYGKDVKSQCSVKAAADSKFLYLRLQDLAAKKPAGGLWSDNFELFFSADGNYPVLQIAAGRNGSSMQLLHSMINDVISREEKKYDLHLKTFNDTETGFTAFLAIPKEALPKRNSFRCNFMRTDHKNGNQAWSPTFTTRYLYGMNYAGQFFQFPLTVSCKTFKFTHPKEAALSNDPAAPDRTAAWMNGRHSWAITWPMPRSFPSGKFKVYAYLRSEAPVGQKLSYRLGFYQKQTKRTQASPPIMVDKIAGKEYRKVLLSTYELGGDQLFFIGGFNGKQLPGNNRIWIHSLVFEPVLK